MEGGVEASMVAATTVGEWEDTEMHQQQQNDPVTVVMSLERGGGEGRAGGGGYVGGE